MATFPNPFNIGKSPFDLGSAAAAAANQPKQTGFLSSSDYLSFQNKYADQSQKFWGLNFDPYKVPDADLNKFLSDYFTSRNTGGGNPLRAITAAEEKYGLQDAFKNKDLASVRDALVKGSAASFQSHGPSSGLIKLAPLAILGAGAALTGGFGLTGLLNGVGAAPSGAATSGGLFGGTGVAGSSVANLSAQGLLGTGALSGTAGGGGLMGSIANLFGGNSVSNPVGSVLTEVIKRVPNLVDNLFAGDQAKDNEAFLTALMNKNSPENLLKSFQGSDAYKDAEYIRKHPESLALFNTIMERATRQANAEAAKSGTLSPGTGELSGGHADLLTRLIFENAGGYHTNILNSLPLTQSANLISGSVQPQLSLAGGILGQRNVAAASNPLRALFGGADNMLYDKLASLFS